jgi:hypothetical protein
VSVVRFRPWAPYTTSLAFSGAFLYVEIGGRMRATAVRIIAPAIFNERNARSPQGIKSLKAAYLIPPLGTIHNKPRFQRGFFVCRDRGSDESHRGSNNCASNFQRAQRAKPAGDKKPQGCLSNSAPGHHFFSYPSIKELSPY